MKVSELAKEMDITSKDVLATLKKLKLKAKDSSQELSSAVLPVVRGAIKREKENPAPKEKPASTKKKVVKKKTVKKVVKKKVVKKKAAKPKEDEAAKTSAKEEKEEEKKPRKDMSLEPVITLKPLNRKKRKKSDKKDDASSHKTTAENFDSKFKQAAQEMGEKASSEDAVDLSQRDESLPDIEIKLPVSVKDFAIKIGQKPSEVLKVLMKFGVFANINQGLDGELVERLTREFGYNLTAIKTEEEQLIEGHKQEEEDESLLQNRAPVITFMGHVDHGKTSLVDRIRTAKIADGEHGGITQHIGAYSVKIEKGRITFLDTPGHEAFTAMRARGAHITDLVVLVVAADEGIMPQTKEAIDHARAADVPIVVAINKIDKPNADPDKIKKELAENDLASEDWGGKTQAIGVSAITGEGIDELLEAVLLESEMLELKANPDKKASGIVVEAHLSQGKGAVTSLIVQSGTLKEGEFIVVGQYYGKIRAMLDDHMRPVKTAGPSMPVEIMGLSNVPEAGENFYVVENERVARDITFKRQQLIKNDKLNSMQKVTLDNLHSHLEVGDIKEFNVIVKADVQGSLEALKDSLEKIPSDKIKLKFIHLGVGDVNTSDVLLANASKAVIIAFHVGIGFEAKKELDKNPVDVREYRIIYDAVDDLRNALEGLLDPHKKKIFQSRIEVRNVFKLSKSGLVAGCYLAKGKAQRKHHVDVIRNDEVIYSGKFSSLKRFKDDVREVTEGMECGVTVEGFSDYQVGDIIESYDVETIAQRL